MIGSQNIDYFSTVNSKRRNSFKVIRTKPIFQMVVNNWSYLFTEATILNVEFVERNVAEYGGAAARRTREAP